MNNIVILIFNIHFTIFNFSKIELTRLITFLSIILMISSPSFSKNYSDGYFIESKDGSNPIFVKGDYNSVEADRWLIRLYKVGQASGGKNNWGLIIEKTAAEAMKRLKESQDFELAWNRWMGRGRTPESRWGETTSFNYTGPIAVMKSNRPKYPSDSKVDKIMQTIEKSLDTYNQVSKVYDIVMTTAGLNNDTFGTSQGLLGQKLKSGLENALGLDGEKSEAIAKVGSVLADYSNALKDAWDKLTELRHKIDQDHTSSMQSIDNSLRELDRKSSQLSSAIKTANVAFSSVDSDRNTIPRNREVNTINDNFSAIFNEKYQGESSVKININGRIEIKENGYIHTINLSDIDNLELRAWSDRPPTINFLTVSGRNFDISSSKATSPGRVNNVKIEFRQNEEASAINLVSYINKLNPKISFYPNESIKSIYPRLYKFINSKNNQSKIINITNQIKSMGNIN